MPCDQLPLPSLPTTYAGFLQSHRPGDHFQSPRPDNHFQSQRPRLQSPYPAFGQCQDFQGQAGCFQSPEPVQQAETFSPHPGYGPRPQPGPQALRSASHSPSTSSSS